MTLTAAERLAELVRNAGARRVAFLGLAKNTGKTTALVKILEELHRAGVVAAATSAGRDGEERDALTGEPKPRFRIWRGQLVASAASTFDAASFPSEEIAALPFATRFGPIAVRRAAGDGEIEVIGPATASQMAETCGALEQAGAEVVLLDGAFGRRAFASARVADALVLATGLAAGSLLSSAVEAARAAVELIRLEVPPPGPPARSFEGALTDEALLAHPPHHGEVLVAEDFASIFLTPERRRHLEAIGVGLAVRRLARLLAVTANPTAPGRPGVEPARLFEELRRALPQTPLFDLVANLYNSPPNAREAGPPSRDDLSLQAPRPRSG